MALPVVVLVRIWPHCALQTLLRNRLTCQDFFASLGPALWLRMSDTAQLQLLTCLLTIGQPQTAALLHSVLHFPLDRHTAHQQALACVRYNQRSSLEWVCEQAPVDCSSLLATALQHGHRDMASWLLQRGCLRSGRHLSWYLQSAALHGDLQQLRWLQQRLQLSGLKEEHRWAAAAAVLVSQHLENWHLCRWLWHTFHLQEDAAILAHLTTTLGSASTKTLLQKVGGRV